ncbi:hypothetical protein [Bacillus mycoides]|uniref:Uncharacterized protein n=1 Tax=Bacillus mycoides (strain KBAB4) TaxID=315730 RepID=A9VVH6_BACMK|nr:hypothetical protein [Bacillus mycoides]ABY46791.1 hypothetical protein BcerKBAB4_5297 [Bacillus mycoides KBAB4]
MMTRELKEAKTVGELIEMLAKYPFNAPIVTNCEQCRRGFVNGVVTIGDRTDQTYGYIDLNVNQASKKESKQMSFDDHIIAGRC